MRAASRGGPAASEKLEIEMESALSPREIQTRIRSGESVADVARVAGVDRDRVERFAAPVIAEREHIAGLAMTSSARRRGETSAHRTLRGVLNERLLNRGIDIDTVAWDSYRLDDGRWAVTADYLSGDTPRQALFHFDVAGRYSVAGNDEGRWVLGDSSPGHGPQPGQLPPPSSEQGDDTEPTIDLSDELALVRAIQDVPPAPVGAAERPMVVEVTEFTEVEVTIAEVVQFSRPAKPAPVEDPADAAVDVVDAGEAVEDTGSGLDTLNDIFADQGPLVGAPSSQVSDAVPSDASAVPELSPTLTSDAWEPAIVVDYPVEPSEDDGVEVPEGSDDPGRPEPPVAGDDRRDEAASLLDAVLFRDPADASEVHRPAPTEPQEQLLPLDVPDQPTPAAPPKPQRRKRASVPSWDEIVFGGPKET
ncbi:MAG TPA: septation protein SepH [Microlunatus sp.]